MADYLDPRNASTALLNNAEALVALPRTMDQMRWALLQAAASRYAPKGVSDWVSKAAAAPSPYPSLEDVQGVTNALIPAGSEDWLRHRPQGPFGKAGIFAGEQVADPLNIAGAKGLRLLRR
jgi:hypothetical protein